MQLFCLESLFPFQYIPNRGQRWERIFLPVGSTNAIIVILIFTIGAGHGSIRRSGMENRYLKLCEIHLEIQEDCSVFYF